MNAMLSMTPDTYARIHTPKLLRSQVPQTSGPPRLPPVFDEMVERFQKCQRPERLRPRDHKPRASPVAAGGPKGALARAGGFA